jgi:hypothetical protein
MSNLMDEFTVFVEEFIKILPSPVLNIIPLVKSRSALSFNVFNLDDVSHLPLPDFDHLIDRLHPFL